MTNAIVLQRDERHAGLDVAPFLIDTLATRIGRVPGTELGIAPMPELVLRDSSVSRDHARIERTPAGFVLRDLGSSNGTFVNGFRLGEFPIKNGDQVQIGKIPFVVVVDYRARGATGTGQVSTNVLPVRGLSGLYRVPLRRRSAADFGVVLVDDYDGLCTELADGLDRFEIVLGRLVAQRLDAATAAFREVERGTLQVLLFGDDVKERTAQLSHDLKKCIADVSRKPRAVRSSTSHVDPVVAIRKASESQHERRVVATEYKVELCWVHLSDLHFGAGSVSWRHDQEQVMASLVRDLQRDRFEAHRVLVTGDIAFSGEEAQYEQAYEALERVAAAVGLTLAAVRVVPGNHDIDRKVARTPLLAALHRHARSSLVALDEMLADERSRDVLLEKTASFREFVRRLDNHPSDPDWRERFVVGSAHIDLWGLSSVWISDELDGRDDRGAFSANLVVGKGQYRELARETAPAALNLVMTHHPLEWISGAHGRWLRSAFAAVPSIHLCGHVHQQAGSSVVKLGKPNHGITLVAGASHADPEEPGVHAYSRGVLRRDGDHWRLGWSPRRYDAERDEFRVDRDHDVESDGYAWTALPART